MKCCNPFRLNKAHAGKNPLLRIVSKQLISDAKKIGKKLNIAARICDKCRQRILRIVGRINARNNESSSDESVKSSIGNDSEPTQSDVEMSSDTGEDGEEDESALNAENMEYGDVGFQDESMHDESISSLEEVEENKSDSTTRSDSSSSHYEPQFDSGSKNEIGRKLHDLLNSLGVRKMDFKQFRSKKNRVKKFKEINAKLAKALFDDDDDIESNSGEEMLDQLKAKLAETNNGHEKVKILSVLPMSWTCYKIRKEFGVSRHLARKVKQLVRSNGIFCDFQRKIRSDKLSVDLIKKIKDFYRSEDISRSCAGKNEYITYNENMDKVRIQRRLILMSLHEAYCLFKEENPDEKIGFSTFTKHRPKECILPNEKYGTHSSCVCMEHQNFKLMVDAIYYGGFHEWNNYQNYLKATMCDEPTNDCKMNKCDNCRTKTEPLQQDLEAAFFFKDVTEVKFKRWTYINGIL